MNTDTQDPTTMTLDMLRDAAGHTQALIVSALYGDDFTDADLAAFRQCKADLQAEMLNYGVVYA